MTREPLLLRHREIPRLVALIRLGSVTLEDPALAHSAEECHDRWGLWGFSVFEVPDGDYELLARLRPFIATRRRFLVAEGAHVLAAGFPLLPTLDHPHWTIVLSEPKPKQFARVRRLFTGPIDNPAWTGRT